MQLRMACTKCIEQKIHINDQDVIFEITDEGIYRICCENKHDSIIFLENHKYEVLFDMGIAAINDGYSREAVSSFAASLERFYEFSIEVLLANKKISREEYIKTWKHYKKSSERQLGAFLFLYLSVFKEAPLVFKDDYNKFRNDVIHNGKFPSKIETIEYAGWVFEYIKTMLIHLKDKLNDEIDYITDRKIVNYIEDNEPSDISIVSWSIDTVFRAIRPVEEIKNIELANEINRRNIYKIFVR